MNAGAAEGEARHEQLKEVEQGRGEEEVEHLGAQEESAARPAGVQEERKEAPADGRESPDKDKPARVQSVFSLVRSQIRMQTALESRRSGMLQLVQRVTRQLDRSKVEQAGSLPDPEATSPGEEVATAPEVEEEEVVVVEGDGDSREMCACVSLLQEVLDSVESLRTEVHEELRLLREETRSHTERVLLGLETRLAQVLRTNVVAAHAAASPLALHRPHPALLSDVNKRKPLSIPPLGAARRRTLSRTMTTITAKSCPPPTLGPRSMSEPLGGQAAEASPLVLPRGAEALPLSLGPLPPSLPPTQPGKRPPRGKTREAKPTP